MRLFRYIIIIFSFVAMQAQTKSELINKQLVAEYVKIDYDNMGGEQSQLADSLSLSELLKYSKHSNPQLRLLSELILINEHKIDLYDLLKYELAHDTIINVLDGCLETPESTSNVIYSEYFNKIISKVTQMFCEKVEGSKAFVDSIIRNSGRVRKLDSLILFSEGQISEFNYEKIFKNPINPQFLPRIEVLAFEKHNFAAFKFLLNKYPNKYADKARNYLLYEFYTIHFETPYDKEHLAQFIMYLLDSEDEKLRKIGIKALKNKDWCCSESTMLLNNLCEEINKKEK